MEKAAINGHQSIAFPVLGVGNLGYPVDEVAKGMIEAVIEYTERNPNSSITDVKIVIFHLDSKAQTVSTVDIHCLFYAVDSLFHVNIVDSKPTIP